MGCSSCWYSAVIDDVSSCCLSAVWPVPAGDDLTFLMDCMEEKGANKLPGTVVAKKAMEVLCKRRLSCFPDCPKALAVIRKCREAYFDIQHHVSRHPHADGAAASADCTDSLASAGCVVSVPTVPAVGCNTHTVSQSETVPSVAPNQDVPQSYSDEELRQLIAQYDPSLNFVSA